MDILQFYAHAVSALRSLDASGVVMNAVCQPIRFYIRDRSDSVRCIVNLLTDQGHLESLLTTRRGRGACTFHCVAQSVRAQIWR